MTNDRTVWTRRSSVVQVGDPERVVMLDLDDPAHPPRILTGPAAAVWQAVDGTRDVTGVCAAVAEQFDLDTEDVADDVRSFLGDLAADGLLRSAPTSQVEA